MLEHRGATILNRSICFSAKLSPTIASSAVIGALQCPFCDNIVCLVGRYLQYDAHPRSFLGRTELPLRGADRRHEARRQLHSAPGLCCRSYACHRVDHPSCPDHCSGWRRQLHSSTAFPVATRHFRRFPFARRRRPLRCDDSVCDKLTRQGTAQMQPSARPVVHYSWKQCSICSSGRARHPHA